MEVKGNARKEDDNMPLRGLLFKKIFATRKEREAIEKKQLASHFKKQSTKIAKIRKERIEAEGKASLRKLLAGEKARLKAAKSTTRTSRFERLLKKEAKAGVAATARFTAKQIKKRKIKVTFGSSGTKRKGKKRRKRRR